MCQRQPNRQKQENWIGETEMGGFFTSYVSTALFSTSKTIVQDRFGFDETSFFLWGYKRELYTVRENI